MADMKELTGSTYFPAEGQSFRNYIEELLKAKPKFSGLFTQQSPVQPISAQGTPAQGTAQVPQSSSAPFGYDSEGNRLTAPQTNLSDAEWAAVKRLRDEQGWDNPYDTNMLKAAGAGLLGVLSGNPLSFAQGVYKASGPAQTAMDYLYEYMNPNAAASPSFNTAALTNPTIVGGLMSDYMPAVNQAIMDPRDAMVAAPVATSYPVSSPSYESAYQAVTSGYTPIQSYTDSSGNTGTLSLSSYTPTYTGSSEGE